MPRIKAGKKALRQTIKRTAKNRAQKSALKQAIKKATAPKGGPFGAGKLSDIQALIDKAVKRGLIHANKAARLKSRLFKKFGVPKKISKKSSQ